jgi:major membrane immunogen (membrane-anchored lipoprotein)
MNRWIKGFIVVFTIIIITSVLIPTGCGNTDDVYKKITIKNELGSYSLEYPSHYEKNIWDNLEFKVPYTL